MEKFLKGLTTKKTAKKLIKETNKKGKTTENPKIEEITEKNKETTEKPKIEEITKKT